MLGVMLGKEYVNQDCALARALEVVGERWTLLILRDAFYGVRRFSDFHAHLDIPKAVLADRLDGLVEEGVLARVPDPEHRGRTQYELTNRGRDLWPAVHALMSWGSRHIATNSRIFKHADCGTTIDDHGTCPQCKRIPEPNDVITEVRRNHASTRTDPVAVALRSRHRLLEPVQTHDNVPNARDNRR